MECEVTSRRGSWEDRALSVERVSWCEAGSLAASRGVARGLCASRAGIRQTCRNGASWMLNPVAVSEIERREELLGDFGRPRRCVRALLPTCRI